jgi:hypothetical protein
MDYYNDMSVFFILSENNKYAYNGEEFEGINIYKLNDSEFIFQSGILIYNEQYNFLKHDAKTITATIKDGKIFFINENNSDIEIQYFLGNLYVFFIEEDEKLFLL